MKTRIISGIVMGIIVAAALALGFTVSEHIITVFAAVIAAAACYELLHNAAGIKSKTATAVSALYTGIAAFALSDDAFKSIAFIPESVTSDFVLILSVLYFVFAVVMILKNHKDFDLARIFALSGMPIIVANAFSMLSGILIGERGLYYFLMLLNFSSVCDMGAYFVGVTLGKHKLCPEISPKKTVEGAIGGIVSSIIIGIVIMLCFGFKEHIIATALLTIPLCILGMLGDLFASSIKRSVGLKDYSNLIPGHGGILDRVDSIILITPLLYILIRHGVI